jgi:cell division protein FtsA
MEPVVGLDIGTTKTCAVIGYLNENRQIEIAGVGLCPSNGMKNGVIINIDNTAASIEKAIENAEMMAGCEVSSVYVGIGGQHVKGENSKGVVAIANRNRTISNNEVRRVIEAAQAIVIPVDREIMHVLSREFSVDDQTGIKDPVGMSGVRLEAEVHIVTAATSNIQNLIKSVDKAGYIYQNIIFNPLASAEAVLTEDEKELGVAIVDIGGGTTDIVVYLEGGACYSSVLSVGGVHVTNDISIGLRTPFESAEMIKTKNGCAVLDLVDASEMIEVPSVGGRPPRRLFRQELTQIIEPRVSEIMEMIDHELIKSGKKNMLAAGIVMVGGGSMLDGCVEAAERVLNLPVRVGVCRDLAGLKDRVATPQFVNGVGLLRYGIRVQGKSGRISREKRGAGFIDSIKRFLQEYL